MTGFREAFSLDGKVALITGAGSGLGYAMAQCMVAAGAKVVMVGRRKDVLEQAALRADSDRIDAAQMEALLRQSGLAQVQPVLPPEPASPDAGALLRPLAEQVAELEQRAIAAALQATGGNKLATARLLGVSRATLYQRLQTPK